MSPSFFISYRRDDNKDFTYRIGDKFKSRYGEQNVFIDFNMEAGIDFHQELTKRVKEGDVLIVVIGVRWLELLKEKAFKQDWVRTEIELALENNRIVVPICLEDAQLPLSDDLPDSLKPLLRLNAKRLRSDDTFGAQIESIFKDIDVAVKRAKKDENPPLRDNLSKFLDVFDLADTDQKLEERYAQARKKLIDAIFEGKRIEP
ncbi:MAG: toll/interleukin-1 receptor domain-containing protein [Chloroflexi bacterium]|uniref:toll/interleukin-1 receptor domain-containing protein n=1 Tax=Candidatus Flexifilum breve TaxID=3140694 RepID=UPI003134C837|nr:toll/interleukin-1 receptor domain-containing protein [Chloroflexota bacterium]